MHIDEERRGSVLVLTPHADVDVLTLPAFQTRLDGLVEDGVRGVVWDLRRVELLPSTALGFLLGARRRLTEVDGAMALAHAARIVRRTLETMGVLDVFGLYDTLEEGVSALEARLG